MPRISVISIAKSDQELVNLREALSRQTFKDFEFVTSTKGNIPQAWNDAVLQATGDIIVATESDAVPLNEYWLEDIAKYAEQYLTGNTVVKGIEIHPANLNMCNIVSHAEILKQYKFDESFPICEDTELFARLRRAGVELKFVSAFPVIHVQKVSWRKTLSRAAIYGRLMMKMVYLHGRQNIESIGTQSFPVNRTNPIGNRFRIIADNVLFLFGLAVGALWHLPVLTRRKVVDRS